MAVPVFPPKRNADLVKWSANFNQKIGAMPAAYGLTAQQAADYAVLHQAFAEAHALANNPATNSKASFIRKDEAMKQLLHGDGGAWQLVNIVQAFPGTTNDQRGSLGLRLHGQSPTRVPRPSTAPTLQILWRTGRVVKIRLRDPSSPDSRGKPYGVLGATILAYFGETPPADPTEWMFMANTSRALCEVRLPTNAPAGSRLWLTAFWFNARMQHSPAATPQATVVRSTLAA